MINKKNSNVKINAGDVENIANDITLLISYISSHKDELKDNGWFEEKGFRVSMTDDIVEISHCGNFVGSFDVPKRSNGAIYWNKIMSRVSDEICAKYFLIYSPSNFNSFHDWCKYVEKVQFVTISVSAEDMDPVDEIAVVADIIDMDTISLKTNRGLKMFYWNNRDAYVCRDYYGSHSVATIMAEFIFDAENKDIVINESLKEVTINSPKGWDYLYEDREKCSGWKVIINY